MQQPKVKATLGEEVINVTHCRLSSTNNLTPFDMALQEEVKKTENKRHN